MIASAFEALVTVVIAGLYLFGIGSLLYAVLNNDWRLRRLYRAGKSAVGPADRDDR